MTKRVVDAAEAVAAGAPIPLPVSGEPPAGYPEHLVDDPYATAPCASTFAARRDLYFAHVRRNPARPSVDGAFHEMARLAAGGPVHAGVFEAACDFVEARRDCADFVLHALLRLLYQFPDDPRLPADLWARMRRVALGFKYWPDEPGRDSMCTWTENHQILFAAAAFLAGGLCPDATFTNDGATGREKREIARRRILRWLGLRFRTGFSEWLSNIYYDEDLTALLNLVDFAGDPEIETRAAMVVDLLLLDVALNSFHGVFGSTHGRSYAHAKKWAAREPTSPTTKLAFGTGSFSASGLSAPCLALSPRYRVPAVLDAVARDANGTVLENRQRLGIRLADAERWGLGFHEFEDGMVFLSLEAYTHPRTGGLVLRMFDAYDWWENEFFRPFKARRGLIDALRRARLLPVFARLFEHDLTRNTREEVHVTTYRTPDYMLSSAQDWRPGFGGDQQHLWQATLGPEAVCFTTHPGPSGPGTPDLWTGSGTLPRVRQIENVALVLYHIDRRPALYVPNRNRYTHAWLPRDRFDEVRERDGWVFARKGDGYLALWSSCATTWQTAPGEDRGRELIAPGRNQAWVCELGRRAQDGDFEAFADRIVAARVRFRARRLTYDSPSQGRLELRWRGPMRRNGQALRRAPHPRYANPYVSAPFGADEIVVGLGEERLELRWPEGERRASGVPA